MKPWRKVVRKDTFAVQLRNILNRSEASTATCSFQYTRTKRPAIPRSSGTNVLQEFHGYTTPPQDNGIKILDVEAMNQAAPTQSIRLSFCFMVDRSR